MRGVIHYILAITIMLSHWSFASANNNSNAQESFNYQAQINEILSKSQKHQDPLNKPVDSTIVVGPFFENSSMRLHSMDADEGRLYFQALEEERQERNIPNENFYNVKIDPNKVQHMSPEVDLTKHPDFFQAVNDRYEILFNAHYEKQSQMALQQEAQESFNVEGEQSKTLVTLAIRWGTTVSFFAIMVSPSTLTLASIAIVSMVTTYMYNNKMAAVEAFISKGGDIARTAPLKALELTGRITAKTPGFRVAAPTVLWATKYYQDHILNHNTTRMLGQLGAAFVIVAPITAIYTIVINLPAIGFAESVAASGQYFMGSAGLEPFLASLKTEMANFEIGKVFQLLSAEPYLKKAALLTIFAETWTIYRMKYRSMVADQTKANNLGRITGIIFALLGPLVHKSSQVLNGRSADTVSTAGVFIVGAVGLAGLAWVFGDGAKYTERVNAMIAVSKDNSKKFARGTFNGFKQTASSSLRAVKSIPKTVKATAAAFYLGTMEITHAAEETYRTTPRSQWEAVPAKVMDKLSTPTQSFRSCNKSFKTI